MNGAVDAPPPVPPTRPEPGDCCNGGCARCVFDVYEEALERYREVEPRENPRDELMAKAHG